MLKFNKITALLLAFIMNTIFVSPSINAIDSSKKIKISCLMICLNLGLSTLWMTHKEKLLSLAHAGVATYALIQVIKLCFSSSQPNTRVTIPIGEEFHPYANGNFALNAF